VILSRGRADVSELVPACYRRSCEFPEDGSKAAPSGIQRLNGTPVASSVGSMTRSTNFMRLMG
jgi:hypothetical protein